MDKKMLENIKFRVSPPVIMLVVALVIAGIVSFWSYGLLQKQTTVEATPADTQQVAVAAYDLKWGTVITSEVVKTQPYLKGSLPTGYIADPAAAIGRVVMYPIQVNEPLTESRLAPASVKTGGVAAIVSPKKRAMAVKVDKVVGVSGFIHPGHRVDILVSLAKTEKVQQPITKIVLENIPVLAVGTEVEQAAGQKEKAAQVDVITLEVSPEEGEKLALAATEGKLQLALRNYTDTEDVQTRGTTIPNLLASYAGASPEKKGTGVRRAAPAAPTGGFTVELIKGSKVSQVKFNRGGE
jgi:pilus assembly protein CpaB